MFTASPDFGLFGHPLPGWLLSQARGRGSAEQVWGGIDGFQGLRVGSQQSCLLVEAHSASLPPLSFPLSPSLPCPLEMAPLVQDSGGAWWLEVPPLRTELVGVP